MTPIERLIACAKSVVEDPSLIAVIAPECALEEYESAPKEGCDTCWSKPDEDVGFPEECASCCHFYASHWEAK